jgi:hypothetical protein
MPNWCQNTVQFKNSDQSKLSELENELGKGDDAEIFMHFRPYEGEWDYGWCSEYWGTKWEARVYDWSRTDENTITIHFDTAWGPPIALFEFLAENEWEVDALYHEEGMCFAGYWTNDGAEEYEYSGMSADEIDEELPSDLNDHFCIAENRREWEEENQDDEEITFDDEEMTEEEKEEALKQLKQDYENLLKEK